MTKSPSIIRQEWVEQAAVMFKDHFLKYYWQVPDNVRLSIGFPIGAKDGKRKLGQCINKLFSKDDHWEIFVSPDYTNSVEILETIAHELVHATVGLECGHRGKFKTCAEAVGFDGPMTFTPAGPVMMECIQNIIKAIGEFPAGNLSMANRKKQSTNLLKCECSECGYIARVTAKWIGSVGEPICPVDMIAMECK